MNENKEHKIRRSVPRGLRHTTVNIRRLQHLVSSVDNVRSEIDEGDDDDVVEQLNEIEKNLREISSDQKIALTIFSKYADLNGDKEKTWDNDKS